MWENIVSVITHLITLVADMTTSLLNNELFIIILGYISFTIIYLYIYRMVKEIRRNKREKYIKYDKMYGNKFGKKGSKERKYWIKTIIKDEKKWR